MGPSRSSTLSAPELAPSSRSLAHLPGQLGANVLELLQPGSFVRLLNQLEDLLPFQLIHCRGGRCWVRQQSWGNLVQWEVAHGRQLTTVG
jgi:hypothetical protein